MAPPLVALLVVVIVAVVVIGGGLWAIRAGLWVRETGPHDDLEQPSGESERGERPRHVEVDDDTRSRQVG